MTRLLELYGRYGQSPWIDNIRRDWLEDGTLAALVRDGVRGVTSNPSIFAKALATSDAYDDRIARVGRGGDVEAVFEALAVEDVRDACDVLAPVHLASHDERESGRRRYLDGFVSLEVSPRLAHDGAATVDAARRLAGAVGRPNLMVKIPATREGLPAVSAVLAEGINVNVTLIFSVERYVAVVDAWMAGLEAALAAGRNIAEIASVASFFVSRVDTAVDAALAPGDPRRGTTAIHQAAAAYRAYRGAVASERADVLLRAGAQVQRPLWASTSVKNPDYDELLYVDNLVGDETDNTMPDATLNAAGQRGRFERSLLRDAPSTMRAADAFDRLGEEVDLASITDRLEVEGVKAFVDSYEEVLATVAAKAAP